MKRLVESLATGFYFGKIPFMPGTWGTLWGLPLAWLFMQAGPLPYMILTLLSVFAASAIAEAHERAANAHDPGEIVIDEVVGYLIAITWLPMTWQSFLAAFVAFRIFDIWKPGPIRMIDRKVKGGLGTVLDDVAAGVAANIVLQIIYARTAWLGEVWHG